jgi:hypothetical protein
MPVRAFVSQDLPTLQNTLAAIESALQSGQIEEIRVAGVITRTGKMMQTDLQLRYNQCRYELYLRVNALTCNDPTRPALLLQFPNPYPEKGMRVSSRSSVGVFGYPLPAPLVPPVP